MNILIAMNDAFVKCYRVMIASLCSNTSEKGVTFYLPYTSTLSLEGRKAVEEMTSRYGAKLVALDFTNGMEGYDELPVGMWSVEMFFRLFTQDFLPQNVDRILWLDGDIIVNRDISEFYNMDFLDNYFIACEDKAINHGKIREEYDNLGWNDEETYVNSGVLLINVSKLREAKITAKEILQHAIQNKDKLHYPDQYILNSMFHDKIKVEDGFLYNCQISSHSYRDKKRILNESIILHFPGYRPWNVDYQKHYSAAIPGDIWWKYARMCGEGKGYVRWKVLNTLMVKPWQWAYNIKKLVMH